MKSLWFGLLLSTSISAAPVVLVNATPQYKRYLDSTMRSLDAMRASTGLINDSIWVCRDQDTQTPLVRVTEALTGPTNIGLDLILLSQRIRDQKGAEHDVTVHTLRHVLSTLNDIEYNHKTGLFFRTYWPDTGKAVDLNLSSVDNLHLAYGLWVVAQAFRVSEPDIAKLALTMFNRMDLSDFLNPTTGLIGGNMQPGTKTATFPGDPQGPYVRDLFDYKYFGSEARSLYTLGFALGLYKTWEKLPADKRAEKIAIAIDGTIAETAKFTYANQNLETLRTWDGGAFQMLLPAILIREEAYSPTLGRLHRNYAKLLLAESERYGVPAGRSASAFGVRGLRIYHGDAKFDEHMPVYNGKSGHANLIASMNVDMQNPEMSPYWEISYTPHAAFMAASSTHDPFVQSSFAYLFRNNENLSSENPCNCHAGNYKKPGGTIPEGLACQCKSQLDLPNYPTTSPRGQHEPNLCEVATSSLGARDTLYQENFGWMDGYFISGPYKGRVVPTQISLDQAMIALSLISLASPTGDHLGSKLLRQDKDVWQRLRMTYGYVEKKFK